jgi:hypothetical protein
MYTSVNATKKRKTENMCFFHMKDPPFRGVITFGQTIGNLYLNFTKIGKGVVSKSYFETTPFCAVCRAAGGDSLFINKFLEKRGKVGRNHATFCGNNPKGEEE